MSLCVCAFLDSVLSDLFFDCTTSSSRFRLLSEVKASMGAGIGSGGVRAPFVVAMLSKF